MSSHAGLRLPKKQKLITKAGITPHAIFVTLNEPTKSSSMQTEPVNLFMLMAMLNQIPEESELPLSSEAFFIHQVCTVRP